MFVCFDRRFNISQLENYWDMSYSKQKVNNIKNSFWDSGGQHVKSMISQFFFQENHDFITILFHVGCTIFQVVSAVQTSFPNKYTINKNGRYLGQIG